MTLSEAERASLHRTFEALCRIESPTLYERACADWLTAELGGMGLEVHEDNAGPTIGSNAGNLLVRIPGDGADSVDADAASDSDADTILLCAHMDTVPLTAPVDPIHRDGGWVNANPAVLGADNKAAVAAIVEVARILTAGRPHNTGIEILFTIAEETGLHGAFGFDVSRLRSSYGYVFDHASPLGEIITASPTQMNIRADVIGKAAHAGLEPERGVNAIVAMSNAIINLPQGRLDEGTTANVGTIHGGTAENVVADHCRVETEIRSISENRVDELVTTSVDAIQDAADSAGCDADITVQKKYDGYRIDSSERSIQVAERGLRAVGFEPKPRSSGGGADANVFRASGFPCTNLANGTEDAHQRTERVSDAALESNLALMLALVDEAAQR
jgi:tripeptide aminopeptidase